MATNEAAPRKFYGRSEAFGFSGLAWAIYEGDESEGYRGKSPIAYFIDEALAREFLFDNTRVPSVQGDKIRGALEVTWRFIEGTQLEHAIVNHPDKPEKTLGWLIKRALRENVETPAARGDAIHSLPAVVKVDVAANAMKSAILEKVRERKRVWITSGRPESSVAADIIITAIEGLEINASK